MASATEDPALCARGYDEVAYLTTPQCVQFTRAISSSRTKRIDVAQQLSDGVRGFMLDRLLAEW